MFFYDEEDIHVDLSTVRRRTPSMVVALLSVGSVIGMAGQQIMLPLFIASVKHDADPYFVFFFLGLAFNFIFWPITWYNLYHRRVSAGTRSYKHHWKLVLAGVCNALNGFMVVFTSPANRVPPALQSILMQSLIPFTIVLSVPILKKRYTRPQIGGAVLVMVGILVSLIPLMEDADITLGEDSHWYFPLIFFISAVPGVFFNIVQEWIFEDVPDFDVNYMLAWTSLYQMVMIVLLFVADILPDYGFQDNMHQFWGAFKGGFKCLFDPTNESMGEKCSFAFPTGLGFAVAYVFAYVFGSYLMRYASANFNAIANSLSPVIVVGFWYSYPAAVSWANGPDQTWKDFMFNAFALPLILLGSVLYRYHERKSLLEYTDKYETETEGVDQDEDPVGPRDLLDAGYLHDDELFRVTGNGGYGATGTSVSAAPAPTSFDSRLLDYDFLPVDAPLAVGDGGAGLDAGSGQPGSVNALFDDQDGLSDHHFYYE